MSKLNERRLDAMIDAFNEESRPSAPLNAEEADLQALVRVVRRLRSNATPATSTGGVEAANWVRRTRPVGRRRLRAVATVAAVALLVISLGMSLWSRGTDVVLAMEQSVAALQSYNGVLEKRVINADGETWLVSQVEIWWQGERYATRDADGVMTVNDGKQRWQVRPDDEQVVLLPLLPDPRSFDLHDEVRRAKNYPHHVLGTETIAGRESIRIQVSPPGGDPYDLWVDTATQLPLRLRTPMQNAWQLEYTFTSFVADPEIDPAVFQFDPPAGYTVVADDPGQLVDIPAEAQQIAEFEVLVPSTAPQRILAAQEWVVLDYGDTIITERVATTPFTPSGHGALGTAGGGPLEVVGDRLRWVQNGIEIEAVGPAAVELGRTIAADLQLPDRSEDVAMAPTVSIKHDREGLEAIQRQVDGGHSPWYLDPVMVAMAYIYAEHAPAIGTAPGDEGAEVVTNTGSAAIVVVPDGPIERVYLQRLVRQDETGIWTVVGYDPRR